MVKVDDGMKLEVEEGRVGKEGKKQERERKRR